MASVRDSTRSFNDSINSNASAAAFAATLAPDETGKKLRRTSSHAAIEGGHRGLKLKKEAISFQFDNLGLVVKGSDGKDLQVLKGVTGKIDACQLVAVMGPSGAGKTTFMVSNSLPLVFHSCIC